MKLDETLFDISTVNELYDVLEDDISGIYEEFRADVSSMISKLKEAEEASDIDVIKSVSHTLKGSSGNIGLRKISEIARNIEENAGKGDISDLSVLLKDIDISVQETLAVLIENKLLK